jgi:acetyltransferase-like isoleucine patch superfamily enzyme
VQPKVISGLATAMGEYGGSLTLTASLFFYEVRTDSYHRPITSELMILAPGFAISLIYYLKFGCFVSTRAEVELSGQIKIGRGSRISSFCRIKASGPLSIGRDVSITNGTCIAASGSGIEIGDDCLISPNVTILSANYRHSELDRPIRQQGMTSKGVKIGNNVWLGAGVVVLDGAEIGDGTIVAPNSVVSSRLPANTIAQGNPARVIFTRR